MTAGHGVGATQLVVACVLAWAVVHKLAVLRRGAAGVQPLIRDSRRRRRFATTYLGLAAGVEAAVAVAAVLVPVVGLPAGALLMLVYSAELRRLPKQEDCNCFGAGLATTRVSAQRRNLVIAGACAAGGVLLVLDSPEGNFAATTWALGLASVALAVLAAPVAAARILNPSRT